MALPSVAALSSSSNPADSNSNEGVDAGSSNVRVKEEKPDEAEIREMAARMVEANKQKMANMPPSGGGGSSRGGGGGQTTLLGYFNRGAQAQQKGATPKAAVTATAAPPDVESDSEADSEKKKPPLDEPSQKGRFGWITMGTTHIPYIFRTPDEKYCAVRIVETSLLNHYMNFLHADIYSCTCIRSYYITDAEARLFNDINMKHCEGQFGRELFTTKDLVVRLEDAREFYTFLDVCYNKLVRCGNDSKDKCGFIRINGESVVPYTVRDNHKYVPLFYFEGETENLKLKAEKLESWHLAYLKFCCKVQGIRNELFASETCSVISLSDIRSYFPPGTLFEDYWPNKVVEGQLLVSGGQKGNAHTGMNHSGGMSWIKIPPGSTPPLAAPTPNANASNTIIVNKVPASLVRGGAGSVIATSPTVVAANGNAWAGLVGGQPTYQQSAQVRTMQPPISSMHSINHTANNRTVYSRANIAQSTQPQYYPSPHSISQAAQLASQPPPLVRVSGSSHSLGPTGAGSYQGGSSDGGATMLPPPPHLQYQAGAAATGGGSVAKYPPPLIPVNGTSATSAVSRYSSIYQPTGGEVIDLSSPPQSPQQRVVQKAPTAQSAENGMWKKLIPISEHPQTQGSHQPFKIQKALVNEKMVPCINAKPYTNTELLMTLPDLVTNFFPSINHDKCRQVLQEVLKVTLYKGNTQQMRVLHQHQKCKSIDEPLALIQCRDVVCYMPQMKYMFGRMMHPDQPVAKRQRLATS
ncbi:uncharacterized protein LOC111057943 isoform X2 [Nilaparvata lugens]|uniref:uncharacterized protein LOC111057943 isoform X2 n=1 Tax=Nilaparvata lugens TaxID=108931 RepID=UPI00193DE1D4|nr:uncharacterized protein LOC111057943 isoform X2 [Nilaparvata lugens]